MAMRASGGWNISKAAVFGSCLGTLLLAVHFIGAPDQWVSLLGYWNADPGAILQVAMTFAELPALVVGIAVVQNLVAVLLPRPAGWVYVRRHP